MKRNTIILIGVLLVFVLAIVAVKSCKKQETVNKFETTKNQVYEKIDNDINNMPDDSVDDEYGKVLLRRK